MKRTLARPDARLPGIGRGVPIAAIVTVHGAGGGGWEWRLWGDVLSNAGLRVHAADLMPAPGGLAATDLNDYQRQVRDWCRAAGAPLVLVGASLGGILALVVAAEVAPAALVLINPIPPAHIQPAPASPPRPAIIAWSRSPFVSTRRALPDADLATARWVHARWRDESGRVIDAAAAGVDIAKPACPVLVMASALDTDIALSTSRATAAALDADFVTVPDASHLGVLLGTSAPSAAALMLAWLNARIPHGNTA